MMLSIFRKSTAVLLSSLLIAFNVHAVYVEEAPTQIRFEQYTGIPGVVAFWRLPTPGVSTFPGGSCTAVAISPLLPEQASRFMALYMFSKTNGNNIFYNYDSSCMISSFGING